MDDDEVDTVFVRNLPYDFTDTQLEAAFEDLGPVKEGFMVANKKGENRGFGFVKFAVANDAAEAVEYFKTKEIAGRKVKVELAKKKGEAKPDKPKPAVSSKLSEEKAAETERVRALKKHKTQNPASMPTASNSKVIVISSLRSTMTLEELSNEIGENQGIIYPSPESTSRFQAARVIFHTSAQATKTIKKYHEKMVLGTKWRCFELSNPNKLARLILRNLSFKATSDDVLAFCSACAPCDSVDLPTKPGSSAHRGFAFVQFKDLLGAQKAIAELNGKTIKNRMVALDWSLNKTDYDNRKKALEWEKEEEKGTKDAEAVQNDDEGEDHDEDGTDEGDAESSADEVDESGDAEVDENGQASQEPDEKTQPKKKVFHEPSEGTTVFVRNISFETTEETLRQKFATYGKLSYVKCVRAHFAEAGSNKHNGSAFVQFRSPVTAQKVLKLANKEDTQKKTSVIVTSNSGIYLDGRQLNVTIAVDKQAASKLTKTKDKVDKKNLYLAREGLILPDSEAGQQLSKEDKAKRAAAYQEKKQKLKNPNYTISMTRLSIRNIPLNWSEKQLKQSALKATTDKMKTEGQNPQKTQPVVSQLKIVRDKTRTDKDGNPRSKRYGFIEFKEHEHALACLRAMNNNPSIFTESQRPLVEFAVDDQRKLFTRKKRFERSTKKQEQRDKTRELQLKEALADQGLAAASADGQASVNGSQKKRKRSRDQATEEKKEAAPMTKKQKREQAKRERKVNRLLGVENAPKPKAEKRKKNAKDAKKPAKAPNTAFTPPPQLDAYGLPFDDESTKKKKKRKGTKLSKRETQEIRADEGFQNLVKSYKKKFFGDDTKTKEITKRWFE